MAMLNQALRIIVILGARRLIIVCVEMNLGSVLLIRVGRLE